jgi:hypothetical protein
LIFNPTTGPLRTQSQCQVLHACTAEALFSPILTYHVQAMSSLQSLVSDTISDFGSILPFASADFSVSDIRIEILEKPHIPRGLPSGSCAIYAFFLNERALKVGKAGQHSGARFLSQHYTGSAMSTLAGSIRRFGEQAGLGRPAIMPIDEWIRQETDRVNLLLPAACGSPVLSLLEAFLHVRWKPLFEGPSDEYTDV